MMITMLCFTLTLLLSSLVMIIFTHMNKNKAMDREKSSAFECGFDSISKARIPFSMRFFLLGVVFLIFDIEIMILLPMPILLLNNTFYSFSFTSFLFIVILTFGFFHEWNEGTLMWSK